MIIAAVSLRFEPPGGSRLADKQRKALSAAKNTKAVGDAHIRPRPGSFWRCRSYRLKMGTVWLEGSAMPGASLGTPVKRSIARKRRQLPSTAILPTHSISLSLTK